MGNPPFHRQTGIAHGEEQRPSALPLDNADLDTGDNAQFGQAMGCLMTSSNGNHSEARSRLSHGQRTYRSRRTIKGRLIPRLRGRPVCTVGVGMVPLATMLLLRTVTTMSLSPSSPSKWHKAMMSDHNEMAAQETTALADGGSAAVLLSVFLSFASIAWCVLVQLAGENLRNTCHPDRIISGFASLSNGGFAGMCVPARRGQIPWGVRGERECGEGMIRVS